MKVPFDFTELSTTILIVVFISIVLDKSVQIEADGTINSDIITCGTPPCRAGCYYKARDNTNITNGYCALAPAGHYSPFGSDNLYQCPKGSSTSVEGSVACPLCPTGTAASRIGSTICIPCGKGFYTSQIGSFHCKKCNPRNYFGTGSNGIIHKDDENYCVKSTSIDSSLICGNSTRPCSGGCYTAWNISVSVNQTRLCSIIPSGFYSPRDDDHIYKCPIGTYSFRGSEQCTPCAPGTSNNITGSGWCLLCTPSTFAPSFGAKSCLTCNSTLYFGPGSQSVFIDEQQNISYCLKPSQKFSGYPTSAPLQSYVPTILSNYTIPSVVPTRYPTNAPTIGKTLSPSNVPSNPPSNSMLPSDAPVQNSSQPTTIFDVISVSTTSPTGIATSQPSSSRTPSSSIEFNSNTQITKNVNGLLVAPILITVIVTAVLLYMLYRNRQHRQSTLKSIASIVPPSPSNDEDEDATLSPTFSVPKIISTNIIKVHENNIDAADNESQFGLYIEDDTLT